MQKCEHPRPKFLLLYLLAKLVKDVLISKRLKKTHFLKILCKITFIPSLTACSVLGQLLVTPPLASFTACERSSLQSK